MYIGTNFFLQTLCYDFTMYTVHIYYRNIYLFVSFMYLYQQYNGQFENLITCIFNVCITTLTIINTVELEI